MRAFMDEFVVNNPPTGGAELVMAKRLPLVRAEWKFEGREG